MSAVTPELADKVLAAGLRNVVKHVSDGGRLSGDERDMIRAEQVTALTEEELNKARIGSLLIKWAKGQRLSKDEKEEVAGHLPSSQAATRSITREKYKHPLQHYAGIYGYTDRAIKAWLKDGREAQGGADLPPLDDPPQMAAWYGRVKQRRVPAQLLKFSAAAPGSSSAAAAANGDPPTAKLFEFNGDDVGYDIAVRFAAESLAHAQNQLQEARKNPLDTGRIEACERSFTRALSEYRKVKNDEHENMKRQGGMVEKRVMLDLFRAKLGALHQGIRSCPVRVSTKLALPPDTVRAVIKAMNDELDGLFDRLNRDGWTHKEQLTLEA